MNVAKLRKMQTDDGKQRLYGRLNQDLPRGALLMLRRNGDDYELVCIANDGRRIGSDPQSLFSFIMPTDNELKAMRKVAP